MCKHNGLSQALLLGKDRNVLQDLYNAIGPCADRCVHASNEELLYSVQVVMVLVEENEIDTGAAVGLLEAITNIQSLKVPHIHTLELVQERSNGDLRLVLLCLHGRARNGHLVLLDRLGSLSVGLCVLLLQKYVMAVYDRDDNGNELIFIMPEPVQLLS